MENSQKSGGNRRKPFALPGFACRGLSGEQSATSVQPYYRAQLQQRASGMGWTEPYFLPAIVHAWCFVAQENAAIHRYTSRERLFGPPAAHSRSVFSASMLRVWVLVRPLRDACSRSVSPPTPTFPFSGQTTGRICALLQGNLLGNLTSVRDEDRAQEHAGQESGSPEGVCVTAAGLVLYSRKDGVRVKPTRGWRTRDRILALWHLAAKIRGTIYTGEHSRRRDGRRRRLREEKEALRQADMRATTLPKTP